MDQNGSEVCEKAFRAFIRAYGLFRNRMDPYFAQFGISGAQWGILRALHRAENEGLQGLRLTDLGARLLVKPPSVTTLVDRLERIGFVARTVAAGDQRAKQVRLTTPGRQLIVRVLKKHPAQIHNILAGLKPSEQRELHLLMEKLATHLQGLENDHVRHAPLRSPHGRSNLPHSRRLAGEKNRRGAPRVAGLHDELVAPNRTIRGNGGTHL